MRQLQSSEALVVVAGDKIESIIIYGIGLDHDTPGTVSATGSPGNLAEERENPFGAAKIWQIQRGVGVEDTNQCDRREIMPLGDHLCTDQDVNLSSRHLLYQPMVSSFAAGGVAIHARHPGLGEKLPDLLFETLRAHSFGEQADSAATVTTLRRSHVEITVVTTQRALYL